MKKEEIIKGLLEVGFKQLHPHRPHHLNYEGYPIVVKDYDDLTSIFKKIFQAGQTVKVWEIKNVLQIQ